MVSQFSDIHSDILQVMNGYWTRGGLRVELSAYVID